MLRAIAVLTFITALYGCSANRPLTPGSGATGTPTDYRVSLDNQVFVVTAPQPPSNEFLKHIPAVSLKDDSLFSSTSSIVLLKMHWPFQRGVFAETASVVQMTVMLDATKSDVDVRQSEALQKAIFDGYTREMAWIKRSGSATDFEPKPINGRTWLKYRVPAIKTVEYATAVSADRFITVRISFIGGSKENDAAVHAQVIDQTATLIESLRISS